MEHSADLTPTKTMIVCDHCGSHDVRRDAYAEWDYTAQDWVLCTVFDQGYCENCGGEASLDEIEITPGELDEYSDYELRTIGDKQTHRHARQMARRRGRAGEGGGLTDGSRI